MTIPDERAPWKVSPEPPGSMLWEMGPGEEFLHKWLTALSEGDRGPTKVAACETNAPKVWRKMLRRFVKDFGSDDRNGDD